MTPGHPLRRVGGSVAGADRAADALWLVLGGVRDREKGQRHTQIQRWAQTDTDQQTRAHSARSPALTAQPQANGQVRPRGGRDTHYRMGFQDLGASAPTSSWGRSQEAQWTQGPVQGSQTQTRMIQGWAVDPQDSRCETRSRCCVLSTVPGTLAGRTQSRGRRVDTSSRDGEPRGQLCPRNNSFSAFNKLAR